MSISPVRFYALLESREVDFFTGVPDSILKEFCLCVDDHVPNEKHVIAANEGNAIALAAGYHLATGRLPLVYMQNSGLGNAVNPLLSLCDPDVYSIPMLVMIGWRGEPGVPDEPQHVKQGKAQISLLKAMDIPYEIIIGDDLLVGEKVSRCVEGAMRGKTPFVMLVKKGAFSEHIHLSLVDHSDSMLREDALSVILDKLGDDSIIISTTGKTSREIFEIRERRCGQHFRDFLTVGSMGHCSSIALGIAIGKPGRKTFCVDGDGALIMHMGNLATIGKVKPKNFYHILINNNVYESVGGQETAARYVDIQGLVKSNGYNTFYFADSIDRLMLVVDGFIESEGPSFLEVKVRPGSRKDLGRPTVTPTDNKNAFMKYIQRGGEPSSKN